jgi:hypothetical protein
MQLNSSELVLQLTHLLAVGIHEGAFTVGPLQDLVYHHLGVTIGVESCRSKLNGDVKAIDEALVFGNVVPG